MNNAKIAKVPGQEHLLALTEIAAEDAATQFAFIHQTNVFGVITVTDAFLPLLKGSPAAQIVNVSCGLASLTKRKTVCMRTAYSSSKAALNAVTKQYAADLKDTSIKVNRVCPGHCATALNKFAGAKDSSDGAKIAVTMAMLPSDGATGGFFL